MIWPMVHIAFFSVTLKNLWIRPVRSRLDQWWDFYSNETVFPSCSNLAWLYIGRAPKLSARAIENQKEYRNSKRNHKTAKRINRHDWKTVYIKLGTVWSGRFLIGSPNKVIPNNEKWTAMWNHLKLKKTSYNDVEFLKKCWDNSIKEIKMLYSQH